MFTYNETASRVMDIQRRAQEVQDAMYDLHSSRDRLNDRLRCDAALDLSGDKVWDVVEPILNLLDNAIRNIRAAETSIRSAEDFLT